MTQETLGIILMGMVVLLPIFFIKTEYGLLTLIFIRPIIDAFSFYSISVSDQLTFNLNALLAIFVCAWAITVFAKESFQWSTIVGRWWLLAFLGATLLSMITSINLTVSLSEWLRLLSIAVLFVVAQHLAHRNPYFIISVIHTAALSVIIPLTIGLYQLITYSGLSFGGLDNRVYGTFGHPNVFGFYLVFVLSIMIIKQLTAHKHGRSLLYPLLIWLSIIGLLFTYTRGAWLGFGIVLATLGIIKYRKPLIVTASVICFLIVFGQFMNSLLITNFNINLNANPLVSRFTVRSDEADSLWWRYRVVATMLPKIPQHPWLGVGIGNFVTLRQQGDISFFEDPEAHNDYLRLAIETGVIGLLLYLGFWITVVFRAARNYRAWPKAAWQKWYSVALIGIVLAFLGMSLGDNLLQGTPVMWLLMTIVGTLVTLTRNKIRP